MNNIDSYDYEASETKRRKDFKFTINFKKIYNMNQELMMDNSIMEEDYPKNILLKMILGTWIGIVLFLSFSYRVLLIATVPLLFFYIFAYVSIYKVWKEYHYKKATFWLITLLGIVGAGVVAALVQYLIFH